MRDSIKQYLKNPNNVKPNLRDVIAETNFNSSFKNFVNSTTVGTFSKVNS